VASGALVWPQRGHDTGVVHRLGARSLALLAALLLATLGVWVDAKPAAACDCAPISPLRALRRADVVFRGSVLSSDRVGRGTDARTDLRFQVEEVYKGTAYREQVVATPRNDDRGCGLKVKKGATWVVFALDGIEGTGDEAVSRLITTVCSGNIKSGVVPAVLGRPSAPIQGRSDRAEASSNTDRALSRGLRLVGFTGLSLAVVVGVGLALIWRPGRPPRAQA
jgi:hypothetical protein